MSILPGWDSLEITAAVHGVLEKTVLALAVLTVVCQIFSHYYGVRNDGLVRAAASEAGKQQRIRDEAAQARLREAEGAVARVQQQQAPRALTEQQRGALIAALSPHRGQKITIVANMNDHESEQFAQAFFPVFQAAGWDLGKSTGPNLAMAVPTTMGVQVTINDAAARAQRVPPGAADLLRGLSGVGVVSERTMFINAEVPEGMVELRVGAKPH